MADAPRQPSGERAPLPPLPTTNLPPEALEKGSGLWQDALRRLLRHRAAMAGAVLLVFMMTMSLAAPWIAAYITHFEFDEQHSSIQAKPPGARSVPWQHMTYFDEDERSLKDADADRDGKVSAEEMSDLLARVEFESFDQDGDGALSIQELEAAPINIIHLDEDASPMALTVWAAHVTAFEARFERFDENDDHRLSSDELKAAAIVTAREGSPEGSRFATLLELATTAQDDHATLDLHRVREYARVLLEEQCPHAEDCPLTHETARLYTDTFPVPQAREFIRDHDEDGDGLLDDSELPGVPEPHTHVLGTDDQGRDLLTRILYGGRISFLVGLLATLVSFIIGVTWGSVAGYAGGRVDAVMMRTVDILYGLPFMFLVILLMVMFGREIYLLFIALGAVQWLTMSRIVRGQIISLKRREFIEAARSVGVRGHRIIFKHLLPNALGPIIVYATLTVPAVMLEEAFLSFLGLGVQPPDASFGTLVSAGAEDMQTYPWLIIYPSLALALTLLSLNFLGDGLRDALDPQSE